MYGHIGRNINAAFALIESVSPSIIISDFVQNNNNTLTLTWQGSGCEIVDYTQV